MPDAVDLTISLTKEKEMSKPSRLALLCTVVALVVTSGCQSANSSADSSETYDTVIYGGTAAARRGASEYTNNGGAQGTTMAGQNVTINFATLLPAADHVDYTVDGELAPGDSVSIIFRAYVQ